MDPTARLVWAKLPTFRVFWPACVYDNYDAATRHTHDLSDVRALKPTADVEDRVVFFFGVRHATAAALSSGIVPTSTVVVPTARVCVVPEHEITGHVWDGADDFGTVCRTHHIPDEAIARAERNSTFLRACSDATRFYEEAHTDEDAQRLFMTFVRTMKMRSNRAQYNAPANATPVEVETMEQKQVQVKKQVVKTVTLSQKPTLTAELSTLCWSMMEKNGWATFAMPGGTKIYAMPGVQFSQFRPNETVFESLDDACIKFLQKWTQQNPEADGSDELQNSFWSMMVESGWQTITSADQVVYVMPNTTFDKFIPNETIFESKQTAIAKFLAGLGIEEHAQPVQDSQPEAQNSDASYAASESEHETSQLDEGSSSDIEMKGEESEESDSAADESDDDDDDNDEDNRSNSKRSTREVKSASKARDMAPKPPRKRKYKKTVQKIAAPVVPPFVLRQGQVEQEIRKRGWYWVAVSMKKSMDGFMFYKPVCDGKSDGELVIGRDCFPGYIALEEYLKANEPEIIEKLRKEHEASYALPSEHSVEVKKTLSKRTPAPKRRLDVIEISDDEVDTKDRYVIARSSRAGSSRRKPARNQIKRYVAPQVSSHDVKFGDVWRVLTERGWYYKPGSFEYDYFKPTDKKKQDMIRGEDYFASRTALEEYLTRSGLWDEIAADVRRDLEADDDVDEDPASPVKRKHSEIDHTDVARTPSSKKSKLDTNEPVDFFTPPPTDRRKDAPSSSSVSQEIEATQDLTALEVSTSQISPDNTASKSKKEEATSEGAQLARNLNNAFTPSPNAEKAKKPVVSNEPRLRALELAQRSISKLSLAHQPSTFAHREMESSKIEEFCRACFAEERGGSLYLSGSPGCGKSALLRSLSEKISQLHEDNGYAPNSIVPLQVNAMGMSDFTQVYCQAAEALMNKEFTDGEEAFEAIERATKTGLKKSKTLLLVLDEIDALGKMSLESELCRLFELAHRPGHSLILVGIANQIDFTERHLASLRLQLPNVKPQVIVFKPYSFQTINDILMDRLGGGSNASRIMNAHGVAFIARKVAAQSGDVRLALDICRRVLQQKLGDLASKGSEEFGPPISLIDIVKVIKVVLEGKSKNNVSSLPRNLQMILFSTIRLVAQTRGVATSPASSSSDDSSTTHKLYGVDDLYECYCDVSHDAGVFKPLTRGEFKLGLETLSSEGMIGAAELKKHLLKLLCTPSELLQTFKNDAYFSRLI